MSTDLKRNTYMVIVETKGFLGMSKCLENYLTGLQFTPYLVR